MTANTYHVALKGARDSSTGVTAIGYQIEDGIVYFQGDGREGCILAIPVESVSYIKKTRTTADDVAARLRHMTFALEVIAQSKADGRTLKDVVDLAQKALRHTYPSN